MKKISKYLLSREVKIIVISESCASAADAEKGKIEICSAIPFIPESNVDGDRADENKDDLIAVTCRCRPSAGNSKKKNM